MEVIQEKNNPFLKRKDIMLSINHQSACTPSKAEIIKQAASKFSVDESHVTVDYIYTKKGIPQSLVKLKIWQEKPKEAKKTAKGESSETQAGKAE